MVGSTSLGAAHGVVFERTAHLCSLAGMLVLPAAAGCRSGAMEVLASWKGPRWGRRDGGRCTDVDSSEHHICLLQGLKVSLGVLRVALRWACWCSASVAGGGGGMQAPDERRQSFAAIVMLSVGHGVPAAAQRGGHHGM